MAFIPVPECAQLDMYIYANGQSMENVFHIQGASNFTEEMLASAISVLQGWITSDWVNVVGTGASVVGIKATALDSDSSPTATATLAEPYVGTQTGDLLPLSVAACVSWRTNLRGRSYRGRTYHTGMVEGYQAAGELTSPALSALTSAYQHWLDAWEASVFSPVIVSRYHNKAARTSGVMSLISSFQLHAQLRSQRRRNVGIGG